MFNEGFVEGIEPGGLVDKGEIKLLICYLLKMTDRPMSKTRINEVMQERAIANYFEVNQAISELLKSGRITADIVDEDEIISLVPAYRFEIETIEKSLPRSIREKAVSGALRLYAREKNENENVVDIEKNDFGYNVTFAINDGGVQMMKLTVFVADENQAQTVKNNFLEDAAGIYSDIIASLTIE